MNQANVLHKAGFTEAEKLYDYAQNVIFFDQTNREGHAAKVYFNRLFGKNFSREYECDINSALDYGYAILLSVFNREVVINGYITQLGIRHINEYNQFNLSCDIMEPFRVIVDWYVYNNRERMFNQEYKYDLINLLNLKVEMIKERRINAVHFESKKTFSQYLYKLQRYCDNLDTEDKASIVIDDRLEDFGKNCIFIWDIFHLNFNDKKLISAITKYVENECVSDSEQYRDFLDSYRKCISIAENYLIELPFETEVKNEVSISDFLKNISVKVVDNTSQSLYDKVLKIIDIAGMVNPKGVLIFANLKSYFEKEELVEIYKYAVYNEVNVLTLEHGECEQPLSYEHILYMDNDFEEYEW